MRKITILILTTLLLGCNPGIFAPQGDYTRRRIMPRVPDEYAVWHAEVEQCVNQTRAYGSIQWFVAQEVFWDNRPVYAIIDFPNEITIHQYKILHENTVKHEMIHYVLQKGGALHGTRMMDMCADSI